MMTQRHFSSIPTLSESSLRIFCNSSDILLSISFICFVVLLTQGTRKIPGKEVGKFARSAADLAIKNNIDLIPIYHDSGLYWKNKKFIKFPGTVKVIIGAPIEGKNSSEMTKNLVDWMNKKASMGTK